MSYTTRMTPAREEPFVADAEPQKITRIPPYWPGCWVLFLPDAPEGLASKVLRVKQLVAAAREWKIVWRVVLDDGRCVETAHIQREATGLEVFKANSRLNGAAASGTPRQMPSTNGVGPSATKAPNRVRIKP